MTKTFVTGEVLTASDVNTFLVNNGFQFAGQRIYTSSGTFEKADPLGTGDIGLRAIRVTVVGGGSAGTTSTSANPGGAGGGGGGTGVSFITDLTSLSASEVVTIGAGGATGGNGGAGGDSSFGTTPIVIGNGGGTSFGAFNGSARGGLGGTAVGDIVHFGSGGGPPNRAGRFSGHGGSSHLGGGASGVYRRDTGHTNGDIGRGHGGGGSGSATSGAPAGNGDGGAGASGIVVVEVFV